MAGVTGGYPTPSDWTSQPRYVDDAFDVMSPFDLPFLKLVGGIKQFSFTNPKIEWQKDDLWTGVLTVSSTTGLTTTTATTLYLSADQAYQLQVGSVLQCEDESLWVTTIAGAASVNVTRGYAGSTAATHSTALSVYLAGVAVSENADAPYQGTPIYSYPYNIAQAFDSAIQSSLINEHTDYYGKSPNLDNLLAGGLKKLMAQLESAMFRGLRYVGASATAPPSVGGLVQYINSTDSNVTDLAGAAITEKNINDLLQTIYYKVGQENMGKTIVCGGWVQRKISSFFEPHNRMNQGETEAGVHVEKLITDFGTLDLVMCVRCPRERLYVINPDFIKVGNMEGLAFAEYELAKSGAYTRKQIYGVYSAIIKNEESMGCLDNISLTA